MRQGTANRTARTQSTATGFAAFFALAVLSLPLHAQWPAFSGPGIPRTLDGKPKLDAPVPKAADGRPDLSGVWETVPCAGCTPPDAQRSSRAGVLTDTPPPVASPPVGPLRFVFANIGADMPDGKAPYQPWAADLVKKRTVDNFKDNPDAHCLPMGIMQLNAHPYPRKVIQTPAELIIVYEGSGTTVREIFLDGRPRPKDADPWWNGYSTGRWDGDTLIIETSGFMDDGWLDVQGSPLTSAATLTEKLHRTSYGFLELTVVIDDPKAYTKPFTANVHYQIMPDTQLIEFVCIDKDAAHYVGSTAK